MISINFDLSEFERAARNIGAAIDQVPYAISLALNESAKIARSNLITETWPTHVEVRNRNFMRASLSTEFASKRRLSVAVFDKLQHANLKMHDSGGTRTSQRGRFAIPNTNVRRTSKGVSTKLKPANLPNSFRKGDVIYQRVGRGGRQLKLMYVLKRATPVPADVPFTSDFQSTMRREMAARFGPAMMRAMRTRR